MSPLKETDVTTAMHATATKPAGMTSLRKTALVAGIFYLITFISIPTLALYGPVKNHRDRILRQAAWVRVERSGSPAGDDRRLPACG